MSVDVIIYKKKCVGRCADWSITLSGAPIRSRDSLGDRQYNMTSLCSEFAISLTSLLPHFIFCDV